MMKTESKSVVMGRLGVLLLAPVLWLFPAPAQSALVTQLDITGGSISLNFGALGSLSGSFTGDGRLLMNQFQPAPTVADPITISHLTFSIFTDNGGALNLPAPTAQTSGATLTANLQSIFANITTTGWSGLLTSPQSPTAVSLNIGGIATGSFNENTNAFDVSWTRSLTGIPYLSSSTISLQGTAQLAAVPVPAAGYLFGTGLVGVAAMARRRSKI